MKKLKTLIAISLFFAASFLTIQTADAWRYRCYSEFAGNCGGYGCGCLPGLVIE